MKSIFLFLVLFSIPLFAGENPKYLRVMGCQTPDARLYMEVFHDQSGLMGAPKNPGYLVLWSTAMGKDTIKQLIVDVPMKHVMDGSVCMLDIKWTSKRTDGSNAISNFNAVVASCNPVNLSPKGKIVQQDVYPSGKVVSATADLNCQLQ